MFYPRHPSASRIAEAWLRVARDNVSKKPSSTWPIDPPDKNPKRTKGKAPTGPSAKAHKPGDVWKTEQGNWKATNAEGDAKSFQQDEDAAKVWAGRAKTKTPKAEDAPATQEPKAEAEAAPTAQPSKPPPPTPPKPPPPKPPTPPQARAPEAAPKAAPDAQSQKADPKADPNAEIQAVLSQFDADLANKWLQRSQKNPATYETVLADVQKLTDATKARAEKETAAALNARLEAAWTAGILKKNKEGLAKAQAEAKAQVIPAPPTTGKPTTGKPPPIVAPAEFSAKLRELEKDQPAADEPDENPYRDPWADEEDEPEVAPEEQKALLETQIATTKASLAAAENALKTLQKGGYRNDYARNLELAQEHLAEVEGSGDANAILAAEDAVAYVEESIRQYDNANDAVKQLKEDLGQAHKENVEVAEVLERAKFDETVETTRQSIGDAERNLESAQAKYKDTFGGKQSPAEMDAIHQEVKDAEHAVNEAKGIHQSARQALREVERAEQTARVEAASQDFEAAWSRADKDRGITLIDAQGNISQYNPEVSDWVFNTMMDLLGERISAPEMGKYERSLTELREGVGSGSSTRSTRTKTKPKAKPADAVTPKAPPKPEAPVDPSKDDGGNVRNRSQAELETPGLWEKEDKTRKDERLKTRKADIEAAAAKDPALKVVADRVEAQEKKNEQRLENPRTKKQIEDLLLKAKIVRFGQELSRTNFWDQMNKGAERQREWQKIRRETGDLLNDLKSEFPEIDHLDMVDLSGLRTTPAGPGVNWDAVMQGKGKDPVNLTNLVEKALEKEMHSSRQELERAKEDATKRAEKEYNRAAAEEDGKRGPGKVWEEDGVLKAVNRNGYMREYVKSSTDKAQAFAKGDWTPKGKTGSLRPRVPSANLVVNRYMGWS